MKKKISLALIMGTVFLIMAAIDLYVSYSAPLRTSRSEAFTDFLITAATSLILFTLDDIHDELKKIKKDKE